MSCCFIQGGSDEFHYVNFEKTGDVSVSILIQSFSAPDSWGKAGVMIRDTLAPNSSHYSMFLTGSNGLANQWRSSTGSYSGHSQTDSIRPTSVWIKVEKVGNQFSSYFKHVDTTEWTAFGSTQTITFSSTIFYVGIAVTSHKDGVLATLHSTDFKVIPRRLRRGS